MSGDAVLKECASRIQRSVRPYDTVGRYGGEELAILLPGCGPAEAVERAEEMRRCIAEQLFATPADAISVTCSFGVGTLSGMETSPQEMVASADRALYAAKGLASTGVTIYLPLSPTLCLAMTDPALIEELFEGARKVRSTCEAFEKSMAKRRDDVSSPRARF
jgi:predicted signal transduction protein with EAL and GGDEF domain